MLLTQRASAVNLDPQHFQVGVAHDRAQPEHPGADQGDGVGVGGVGLAVRTAENTRARAASFGGTSTTSSPAASSRSATWRPIPLHLSTAQTGAGQRHT